jgi:hypothetical protein
MPGLSAQVRDATGALPDFNPRRALEECACSSQRRRIRSAFDVITGRDVVGRVELLEAIMVHA